jgi:hypothetical protein
MAALVFTALDIFQGTPAQYALQPRQVGTYVERKGNEEPKSAIFSVYFQNFSQSFCSVPSCQTAQYFGALWLYNAAQCPMEAIQGRPSLWHNIISAGTIGYLGVRSGRLGVPFVNPYMLYHYNLRPQVAAFGVYGGMAGILAGVLGGKRF